MTTTSTSTTAIETRASSALLAARMLLIGAMPTLLVCLVNSQLPVHHPDSINPHLWSYRLIFLWMLVTSNLHWAVGFVLTTKCAGSRFRTLFGFLGICLGLTVYGLTLSGTEAIDLGNGLGLSSAADHAGDVASGFLPAYFLSRTRLSAHPAFSPSRVVLICAGYSMLFVELDGLNGVLALALPLVVLLSLAVEIGSATKRVPLNVLVALGIQAVTLVIHPSPTIGFVLIALVTLARSGWAQVPLAMRWVGDLKLRVQSYSAATRHRPIGLVEDAAVGLAALIAVGVRPVARAEWTAERAGGPDDGMTQAQHLRLVLGLIPAAAKIRGALLVAPLLRFVDWIAVSESRTRRAAIVLVSTAATYLFKDYGFAELLRTSESLAVLGGGVYALARFRREVVKERERIAGIDRPADDERDTEHDQ